MRRTQQIAQIPKTFEPKPDAKCISRVFSFNLITPMFGGGAESWKLNLDAPIRGQSIKGQLRFWWRTMQNIDDNQELLRKENRLFGGKTGDCHKRSDVSISIEHQTNSVKHVQAEMENRYAVRGDIIPKYVLFPITETVKKGGAVHFITECAFHLHVSYPHEAETEVLDTLKLWCLFGGVGARTRRGCGSIYCEELLSEFSEKNALYEFVNQFGCNSKIEKHDAPYPMFRNALLALGQPERGGSAGVWHGFLDAYSNYRQGPGCGRNGTSRNPGRSFWPEPDSLRRITGKNEPRHAPEHLDGSWFPKVAYGLPIITRFKDKNDPGGGQQINIEPTGANKGDRWPSPMILKVIQLASGEVCKCCLVLNAKPPDKIEVRGPAPNLPHVLKESERPLNATGKVMRTNDHLQTGENPYTALIRYLGLEVGE